MTLLTEILPCFDTNYSYFVCDPQDRRCAVIDPGDSSAVADWLKKNGMHLVYILNTHHHSDHTGGNLALKQAFGAQVLGPASEQDRIAGLDVGLGEETHFDLFGHTMRVLHTPGHTRGSVCYYIDGALFTGDTLFAMGCGRLFEGDAATMLHSLGRIAALADETVIYPGHEYALADARFAVTIEPGNAFLHERLGAATAGPFGAVSLSDEKKSNPFLRTAVPAIRAELDLSDADDAAVFAEIRRRKDLF